jgi:hypothetical protein
MEKSDPKFLFKVEMPDIEFLTAYKALDLAASILLRDGRSIESILEAPAPTRFVDMDDEAASRYLEATEFDAFNRRVFDDPIEYAEKFPRLATLDRLKDVLSQLVREQKIALHFSVNLLQIQPTTQLDDDAYLTTILFFEDFATFANTVGIDVKSKFKESSPELPKQPEIILPKPVDISQSWELQESPKRFGGYRRALFNVLKQAKLAQKPRPNAREVLDMLKELNSVEITVMPNELKYNNVKGDPKEADLKAIGQAIKGLLKKNDACCRVRAG